MGDPGDLRNSFQAWEPLSYLVLLFECFEPCYIATSEGHIWEAEMKVNHQSCKNEGCVIQYVNRLCRWGGCGLAFTRLWNTRSDPDKRTGAGQAYCRIHTPLPQYSTACQERTNMTIISWMKHGIAQQSRRQSSLTAQTALPEIKIRCDSSETVHGRTHTKNNIERV